VEPGFGRDAVDASGPGAISTYEPRLIPDVPEAALPAAKRNLLAHLIDLAGRDVITADPDPSLSAFWKIR
jgi:hypothetical protein